MLLAKFENKQQVIINYLKSLAIAFCFFSPWLIVIITGKQALQDNTIWMENNVSFVDLIAIWIGTILLIFADLPISPEADAVQIALAVIVLLFITIGVFVLAFSWHKLNYKLKQLIYFLGITFLALLLISILRLRNYIYLDLVTIIGVIVAIFILFFASYSLYFTIKNSKPYQWLFIICLMLSLPVSLLVLDLISQRHGSGAPRYLIPTQLAIQIASAYTLGSKLESSALKSFKQNKIWVIITILCLTLGVFSCNRNLNLSPIYLKSRNINNPAIAKIINQERSALVLIEPQETADILSLSHLVLPHVKFKIIDNDNDFVRYSNNFSQVFILKPSSKLKTQLSSKHQLSFQQAYKPNLLSSKEISLDLWSVSIN